MSRSERVEQILSHVLPSIAQHRELIHSTDQQQQPFILGLTGLQGCGKSTLAADIVASLNEQHQCRAIEISLDDFYLTHAERQDLRQGSVNALLRVRGQPGTHDCVLARNTLKQFSDREDKTDRDIVLPIFDKSLFNGDGDRLPETQWRVVSPQPSLQVLVFEGWCIGFRPLSEAEVEAKWKRAKEKRAAAHEPREIKTTPEQDFSTTTLASHRLEDLLRVNESLMEYCNDFMGPQHFDLLIHLDTDDLINVYRWRMEQEHMMMKKVGSGMSDSQVVAFGKSFVTGMSCALS